MQNIVKDSNKNAFINFIFIYAQQDLEANIWAQEESEWGVANAPQ